MSGKAAFSTEFTGRIGGGPCPVCGRRGNLRAHHGTYGTGGMRTIVHFDESTGTHECSLPIAHGWLWVGPDPEWEYKANEEMDS